MTPKYNNEDIVIFNRNDNISSISSKDCIIKIKNYHVFKHVTVQNDNIILSSYNTLASDNDCLIYNKEQIKKLPVEIVGIAREIRRKP